MTPAIWFTLSLLFLMYVLWLQERRKVLTLETEKKELESTITALKEVPLQKHRLGRKELAGELPPDARPLRASGQYTCEVCGKIYYNHPMYNYPGYTYGPIKGCDGNFYHL